MRVEGNFAYVEYLASGSGVLKVDVIDLRKRTMSWFNVGPLSISTRVEC